ncbi:MAG: FxLD family lanthipeptide [Pseudonocardiales bacterium]|nr:FxLD family lanthipeptide [Pseudonocardiales bacterium]
MTVQRDQRAAVAGDPAEDAEFDLDISIVESAPVVDELMRITSDNCGATCESACRDTGC